MTVLDNTPRDQYTASGGQVAFTYTFEIAAEGDIAVLQNGTLLNLGTGAGEYAVTGVGVDAGGVVTLVTGATAGDIITLYRDMALNRLTSYTNGGDFLAADVNNDYDRLWLALQQNTGVSNRALVAPNTDPTDINMTIPGKTTRLGKLLKFNATTGNPEVVQYPFSGVVSITDFGADPTGVTDSTAAINSAVGALSADGTLLCPAGTYLISSPIIFDGKNATVWSYGANFTLVGDNTGFVVKGTITNFTVLGGSITGDNNATRPDSSTAQIGWLIGDAAGATINNVTIRDVRVTKANVGFKASYGIGGIIAYNVRFINCEAIDSAGSAGGVGYGFQFAQVSGGMIDNCLAANCTRHGIYLSEGADYIVSNCYVKDCGPGGGSVRGAIAIARSNNVSVTGCSISNSDDVGMIIDDDDQGLAPSNFTKNVTVTGCTFKENVLGGLWVGTSADPAADGFIENLIVDSCSFFSYATNTNNEIRVTAGKNIILSNSIIDTTNAGASQRAVALTNEGGSSYTNNVSFLGNQFVGVQNVAVELAAGLGTNNVDLRFSQNHGISYTWLDGAGAVTNNAVYTDDLGQIGNSGATPNIGAGNRFLLTQNPDPVSVTSFVGGYEGKRISIQFGDSNSTLTTNMYLAGNTNFAAAINDQIVLEYRGTQWREISRTTQS